MQVSRQAVRGQSLPRLALPNRRPPLVDDEGGGGFWICEAVGARDWRIEYVRCMLGGDVASDGCGDVVVCVYVCVCR